MSHFALPFPDCPNPFASRFVRPGAMVYRDPKTLMTVDVDCLLAELESVRRAAIVGDHGTGKSTLLHTIAAQLESQYPEGRWVQLTRDNGFPIAERCREVVANVRVTLREQKSLVDGGVLVIDGAEQLPAWVRAVIAKRTQQRGQACLITTHRPVKRFKTIFQTALDHKLIEFLVTQLTTDCSDPELIASVRERIKRPIDNARELWSDLYDDFELRTSTRNKGDRWPSV